jgi:hypothetical protein
MEVFDRSLTNIPIELHTNYISNFQIKYIPVPDQFVWSGLSHHIIYTRGSTTGFVVVVVVVVVGVSSSSG